MKDKNSIDTRIQYFSFSLLRDRFFKIIAKIFPKPTAFRLFFYKKLPDESINALKIMWQDLKKKTVNVEISPTIPSTKKQLKTTSLKFN